MSLSLLLDGVVILLLLATICYAAVLNRRLARLRAAKTEMEKLFKDFGGAAADALEALSSLSTEGQGRLKDLDRRIEQGRALADDLVFLIERAGPIADRLEATPQRAGEAAGRERGATPRDAKTASGLAEMAATASAADDASPESALIKALKGVR